MIFYKPLKQIAEEAKILRLERIKWLITFFCFLLFMYKACLHSVHHNHDIKHFLCHVNFPDHLSREERLLF